MFIESVTIQNFRSFGPDAHRIELERDLSVFVGGNGCGKTAVMHALLRMFGLSQEQRRLRVQDFHVPRDEETRPARRDLAIEVIVVFPELDQGEGRCESIPEFFHQLAANADGELKCRFRLDASWTDDGSLEGSVESRLYAIHTLDEEFRDDQKTEIRAAERSRIQLLYIPARRDAVAEVTAFLKGRLWRAIEWSTSIVTALREVGTSLNDTFSHEDSVKTIREILERRWKQLSDGDTNSIPVIRPVDVRLERFIRQVEIVLRPDECGKERSLDELSEGQSSLFHLALTAATLDLESSVREGGISGFLSNSLGFPSLTIIAMEEPENHLAPYYLSRIIEQVEDLAKGSNVQAVISSHSPSILSRVEPDKVRYFQLTGTPVSSITKRITLPDDKEEAGKYVREAVRAFPELYFARFVVLGEGDSEEIIIPRLAKALGFEVDRSFVAIVPLGGRHVDHFWRLLDDLLIPYATLLDLDYGRDGGGYGRIANVYKKLFTRSECKVDKDKANKRIAFCEKKAKQEADYDALLKRLSNLQKSNVFFCEPLDIDFAMLQAYFCFYTALGEGDRGPSNRGDAKGAVLGDSGAQDWYPTDLDELFKWYRYLFLGRGKPTTHLRVMSTMSNKDLVDDMPESLKLLVERIKKAIGA